MYIYNMYIYIICNTYMYTYLYHICRHSQISGCQNFTWIWHIICHKGDSTEVPHLSPRWRR